MAFHEDEGTYKTEASRQNKTQSHEAEAKLQTQSLSAYGLTNAAQYVHTHSLRMWICLDLSPSVSPSLSICFPKENVIAQKLLFHSSKKKRLAYVVVLDAGVAVKLFNQRIVLAVPVKSTTGLFRTLLEISALVLSGINFTTNVSQIFFIRHKNINKRVWRSLDYLRNEKCLSSYGDMLVFSERYWKYGCATINSD